MKKLLLSALMVAISSAAHANILVRDTAGFYLGAGLVGTDNDGCANCDSDGLSLELGYDFNNMIGLEFKYAETDYDHYPRFDLDFNYYGVNFGYDFGTPFLNLYAKLGLMDLVERGPGHYVDEFNPAYGVGLRFTPFGDQNQFYIKLEGLMTTLDDGEFDDDLSIGYLGLGYKF